MFLRQPVHFFRRENVFSGGTASVETDQLGQQSANSTLRRGRRLIRSSSTEDVASLLRVSESRLGHYSKQSKFK